MTEELYALEADVARIEIAIHCIKECHPENFTPLGNKDGWERQQAALSTIYEIRTLMNKKIRALNRLT